MKIVFSLAFTLAIAQAADPCAAADPLTMLKTNLTGLYCGDALLSLSKCNDDDGSKKCPIIMMSGQKGDCTRSPVYGASPFCVASSNSGSCGGCCKNVQGTCSVKRLWGEGSPGQPGFKRYEGCSVGTQYDMTKDATKAADGQKGFQTSCCTKIPDCSTITCPSSDGYIANPVPLTACPAGTACGFDHMWRCCAAKPLTCRAHPLSVCQNGTNTQNRSKMGAEVKTPADYSANCCYNRTKIKCTGFACPVNYEARTQENNGGSSDGYLQRDTCCKMKAGTCLAMGGWASSQHVPAGMFPDVAKAGNAAKADYSDYAANCCSQAATCAAFVAAAIVTEATKSTSLAPKAQTAGPVELSITFAALNFTKLTDAQKIAVAGAVQNSVLEQLTPLSAKYKLDNIKVTLKKGSVIANVVITPVAGTTSSALIASLDSSKQTQLQKAAAAKVTLLPGIDSALADGKKTTDIATGVTGSAPVEKAPVVTASAFSGSSTLSLVLVGLAWQL